MCMFVYALKMLFEYSHSVTEPHSSKQSWLCGQNHWDFSTCFRIQIFTMRGLGRSIISVIKTSWLKAFGCICSEKSGRRGDTCTWVCLQGCMCWEIGMLVLEVAIPKGWMCGFYFPFVSSQAISKRCPLSSVSGLLRTVTWVSSLCYKWMAWLPLLVF